MKRMIIAILLVMMLAAIFAGCARDDRDETYDNVTPYVSPTRTAAPIITQPATTMSPTDVLPDSTPGVVQSPIVTQDVDQ